MAVATETVGLGMTATGAICPVLWAVGVRVEAMATLMASHPNFWKIWALTDLFTQGK
jgi:C4-dicarboxylate transporter